MSDEMLWSVSAEDVAKNKLVDPGMYPTKIIEMEITDSAKKDSKNVRFTYQIFAGPNKGVECWPNFFNEKFKQAMVPLLLACGFAQNPDGSIAVKLTKEVMVGKTFLAQWNRGEYQGKPCNTIVDYAPLPSA